MLSDYSSLDIAAACRRQAEVNGIPSVRSAMTRLALQYEQKAEREERFAGRAVSHGATQDRT